ncbi:hypothetical protein MHO82_22390 [Vibrio sp. Of7-15]|uniref:hypothetical protein n=1 Tax=Vibrio sp. Of7-15 TaxID=2724879 RepID=UPI001EF3C944|nr:hypothetical protein [Vibrio sp. Of7-15]MCG7499618.1 hypothetical protein [Vibrio sp. Of7-15]
MDLKRKEQYEAIRQSVMNDPVLKDNPSRLVSFMEHYIEHIKNEPAIMEWEMNLWERYTREIFVFIYCGLFFFTVSGYIFSDNTVVQETNRNLGIFVMLTLAFLIAMSLSPERYYHKITSTGIYVYSYKRGKAYREKLVMGLLVVGSIAAVVLLFILGPMAFAGAGAGTLGLFSLAAMAKDKPPKEIALPWEAIYFMEYIEEDRWLEKERMICLQGHIDLICNIDNYQEARRHIELYLREDLYIIKDIFSECESLYFLKVQEKIEKEIDFLLSGLPD